MGESDYVKLPVINLLSSDRISTATSIRQACTNYGFFYLINHGVEEQLLENAFDQSRMFFSLPLVEKMKLSRKEDVGYAPIYAENLDSSTTSNGDSKETFHIGPLESHINQWPSKEMLPSWRSVMEMYYKQLLSVGKRLSSLIALALNLEDDFFEKIGAVDKPAGYLRLLHYPGEIGASDEVVYGASAHSDYGMITLLATNGVPGLQVCKEKHMQPRIWENVSHVEGAFIVNIGDMMERWTNCLFRSTLHRVMPTGKERYSMAFFCDPNYDCVVECLKTCCSESNPPRSTLHRVMPTGKERYSMAFFCDPNYDCVVECLKTCCSESNPPRFPPIRSGDYLRERIDAAYSS